MTLGFLAGYPTSPFGRPQDRLWRVLVSEPFANSRDFPLPTRYANLIGQAAPLSADAGRGRGAGARPGVRRKPAMARRGMPHGGVD